MLYVVSGDLAHSHKTNCSLPLYMPDPRWNMPISDTALPFDWAIEEWIKCMPYEVEGALESVREKTKDNHLGTWDKASCKVGERWLAKAVGLKNSALSCGIYGFGVLHGILSAQVEQSAVYDTHFFCRLAPTYYGMVVAAFIRRT